MIIHLNMLGSSDRLNELPEIEGSGYKLYDEGNGNFTIEISRYTLSPDKDTAKFMIKKLNSAYRGVQILTFGAGGGGGGGWKSPTPDALGNYRTGYGYAGKRGIKSELNDYQLEKMIQYTGTIAVGGEPGELFTSTSGNDNINRGKDGNGVTSFMKFDETEKGNVTILKSNSGEGGAKADSNSLNPMNKEPKNAYRPYGYDNYPYGQGGGGGDMYPTNGAAGKDGAIFIRNFREAPSEDVSLIVFDGTLDTESEALGKFTWTYSEDAPGANVGQGTISGEANNYFLQLYSERSETAEAGTSIAYYSTDQTIDFSKYRTMKVYATANIVWNKQGDDCGWSFFIDGQEFRSGDCNIINGTYIKYNFDVSSINETAKLSFRARSHSNNPCTLEIGYIELIK